MMGQATPLKPMTSSKEKLEQSTLMIDDEIHSRSSRQLNGECVGHENLSLTKVSNGVEEPVDGNPSLHELETTPAVEEEIHAGSPSQNPEPGSQVEQTAPRTVRTRAQDKREKNLSDVPIVSALAAGTGFPNKKRGRRPKSESPTENMDALATGQELTGELEREEGKEGEPQRGKRIRRPNTRLLNGNADASAAGTVETQKTKRRKSLKTPIISTDPVGAGPELANEDQTTKKRRSRKVPITSIDALATDSIAEDRTTKKVMSPKSPVRTTNSIASGEHAGSVHSAGEHAEDRPVFPVTAGALLPGGGIRSISTQIKKRGRSKKSQIGSLGSSGAGPSEGHDTQLLAIEGASSKGGDVGSISTPRKRKGRPRRLPIGSIDDLPAGTSISESDDQPLSMLFGLHRPTAMDDPRHSSLGDAGQMDEAGQIENRTEKGTPTSKAVVEWSGSSPFIKSSPIWRAIESMEVFHRFPQSPHFLPLSDLKEGSREGLAIGNMVTFANIVDKAFKLKLSDPVENISTCLETLRDLEPHGFDITAIEDHLKKMLTIKEGQAKLQDKKKEVENQILQLTHETAKIDEEIIEFNEKIKRLQEELASAKSMKEEKDSEVSILKSKLASIAELIDEAALNTEDATDYYHKLSPFL